MQIKIHLMPEKPKINSTCLVFYKNNQFHPSICFYLDKTDDEIKELGLDEGFYKDAFRESYYETHQPDDWILAWVYLDEINDLVQDIKKGERND